MRSLLLALGLFTWALAPPGLSGQVRPTSPREAAEERRLAYDAKQKQYEADQAEEERIRHEWNQLMDRHAAAVAREDDDEVRRLRGQLQELAPDKRSAENARKASQEEWLKAGDSWMDALNAYLDVLDDEIQKSQAGPDDTASKLYNDYEKDLRRLEQELASVPRDLPELVMPEVEIRPEDGPRDIERKLSLLEDRVAEVEDWLATLDREIDGLTRRQARERRRSDSEANEDRFDLAENPTRGGRTNVTGDAGVTDSAAVALQPLEDRIDGKNELKQQVLDYLTELMKKVEEFRRKAGGG